jgi:hypothetical protein
MRSRPEQRLTLRRWAKLHEHECEVLGYEDYCRLLVSRRRLEREHGADFRGLRDPITGRRYLIAESELKQRSGASTAC